MNNRSSPRLRTARVLLEAAMYICWHCPVPSRLAVVPRTRMYQEYCTYRSRIHYPLNDIRTPHTYRCRMQCHEIYYRVYLRNNKNRKYDGSVVSLILSNRPDSGETPLCVGCSIFGSIVDLPRFTYEGYTYFIWSYVAENATNELQSGTITFGLINHF